MCLRVGRSFGRERAQPVQIAITARTRRRDVDLGIRTFLIDVQMDAIDTVAGHGYDVVPQRARLVAWWSA